MKLLLLLCVSFFAAAPRTSTAFVVSNPRDTVRAAVSAIDQDYLRAKSNPAWQQAKQTLLAGRYLSTDQAYRAIGEQLDRVDDPELYLMSAQEFRAREEVMEARRVGTGLPPFAVNWDRTGAVRVVTALGDSPAARAGIQPQDIILSIDGRATKSLSRLQVTDALEGQSLKNVRLVIQRGNRTRRVTLHPSKQPLKAVQFSRRKMDGKWIGYIRVLLFTPGAGDRVRYAVAELQRKGVDGYVLDLRNNPGGLFSSAEQAASAFTTGVLGTEVHGNGSAENLTTYGSPLTGKPLFVLIDGGTARAAELLASGLHDLHRAVLVGTGTYGLGLTQTYVPLSDGYGVMVPEAEIHTPTGQPLQPAGVRPDLAVSGNFPSVRNLGTKHDAQYRRAVAVLTHS